MRYNYFWVKRIFKKSTKNFPRSVHTNGSLEINNYFIKVGQHVAEFINYMLNRDDFSFLLSDIHIIGFSLGRQVAGKAGAALNGNLARITGLDPAGD